jgi:hypothetical protein
MLVKQFWKLITLIIVIVIVLVTYFVQTGLVVAGQYPEFVIKKVSGDESEIKNVEINGDYYHDNQYSSPLTISNKGSLYFAEQSYFKKLESHFPPNEASKLKENYRSFMRGKWYNPASYFENDEFLAYVDLNSSTRVLNTYYQQDYSLKVDVLDKKTKDTNAFDIKIPGQDGSEYFELLDVQMIDGLLKVVTRLHLYSDGGQEHSQVNVYTIDPAKKKLIGDETIVLGKEKDDNRLYTIGVLNDGNDIQEERNLVLLQEELEKPKESPENEEVFQEDASPIVMSRSFYIYNLETMEMKELSVTDDRKKELVDGNLDAVSINENKVYLSYQLEGKLTVLGFSLDTYKEETNYSFNLPDLEIENLGDVMLKNDRVYVSEAFKDSKIHATVFVGDVTSGKVLYQGEIGVDHSKKDNKIYHLEIYNLVVQ